MLDWLARLVTTRRALVLAVLVLVTAGLGSQIPKIQVDPSVENLISSYEGGGQDVSARFEEDFGDTDRVMVLLVEADDVLQTEPLQHLHDLTEHLDQLEWIERVVSLTHTPMPRRIDADEAGAEAPSSFDDLEQELFDDEELDGEGEGDLEGEGEPGEDDGGLAALEAEMFGEGEGDGDLGGEDDFRPEVVDALVSLVEADPDRFPGGFRELGPQLQRELKADPIVEGEAVTEEDVEELRESLAQSDLVEGRLLSEDHSLAVSALFLAPLEAKEMRQRVGELREYLAANPPPEGVEVHLGGLPYLRSAIVENIRSDQIILVPLTLLVCVLLLGIALRWLPGVLLPIGAVGLTAVMVVGAMALAGEPFNVLNNIIATLLIIIGISDSIHLIGRYREELHRAGEDQDEPAKGSAEQEASAAASKAAAGRLTVRSMAVACLLTSVTTAVGLASLLVSKTVMLRHFGVTSALGVMAAYVVTITFLPAILTWVKKPSKAARKAGGGLEVGIMKMTAWVLKRPWQILALTAVLLGLSIWGATALQVDHALLDQFDADDPVARTTRLLEEKLDGVRPLEVSLRADEAGRFYDPELLAAVDEVAAWARGRDEVLATMSQNDMLRQSLYLLSEDPMAREERFRNREQVRALSDLLEAGDGTSPLATWVTEDRKHMRFQIKVRDVGAQATMRFIEDLEGQLEGALGEGSGVRFAFTGEAYDGSIGMDAVVGDPLNSLLTAVVIIFVLLTLLFRSIRLGLLSIPPNVIPLVFTMAYMVWRQIPLNAATVIIFSISLGLAVDGSIHVLARFREETRERHFRAHPALIRAARGTGRAIVVSCVTLMAGFGVLLMSNFVPVRRFGELIAVTVGGTLFATLVVQPALLQIAGISRRVARRQRDQARQPAPQDAE